MRACLYHIPQVCGVGVPPEVLGRLRSRYGAPVSGVKDSSGDFASFLAFRRAAPEVAALVGAELLISRALAEGGAGTICGMANLAPSLVRAMFTDPAAETVVQQACAPIDGIPMLKAVLAEMVGEPIFRTMPPPLRAADATKAVQTAALLRRLQGEQRLAAE